MDRYFMCIAAIGGFLGIAAGTFAAHVIKGEISDELLMSFKVGVQYQMYHSLALFAIAWACTRWPGRLVAIVGWLMILGTIIFCGSLYAFALTEQAMFGQSAAAGGMILMFAWLMLAMVGFLGRSPSKTPATGTS